MLIREGGKGSGFFGHSGRPPGSARVKISKHVQFMFGKGQKRPSKRFLLRYKTRVNEEASQMSKFVRAHRNLSEAKKRGNISALETHWKKRLGSDLKKGQFTMLRKSLANKSGIENPEALSAWWHKKELGVTPTEKYAKMGWRRKKRGKKAAPAA